MINAREIKVRIAKNSDAEQLANLALMNEVEFDGFEVDWSDVWPYWVVAEHNGEIIGAIQTCPSKPIGRIEMMLVDPSLRLKARTVAVRMLVDAAQTILRHQGSQLAAGTISFETPSFLQIAERRGWFSVDTGCVVMRRLR